MVRSILSFMFFSQIVGTVVSFSLNAGMVMKIAEGPSISRRELFQSVAVSAIGASTLLSAQNPASAEVYPGADRLKKGYDGLTFLLDNWESETTACDANNECRRDPDKVRKYLGLRSTKDPLFQIEKVLEKGQNYIEDLDDLDEYIGAVEDYIGTTSMANSMAYTSSFGEYNPGGGKDAVEKYLEESRKQVVSAYKALGKILDLTGLK
mmetsp:Transcript_4232/g.5849  ORF Transcript_4232/g.5849 Transcript_4232/m.5849 type:complete len:208 (-) Transcript_4232:588-1211(-)